MLLSPPKKYSKVEMLEFLKQWKSLIIVTVLVPIVNEPIYTSGYLFLMGLYLYLNSVKYLNIALKKYNWITIVYLAISGSMLATPALAAIEANEQACSQKGLFAPITNFIDSMFGKITFQGFGGGALSSLLCQVVGFFILGAVITFLAGALEGANRWKQGETIAMALQPLIGFLLFGGMATIMLVTFFGPPVS